MSARAPYLLDRHAGGVLRTAHRGASRLAPDNTLEAIEAAARFPVDFVEVDVQRARDGGLLLWHDAHLITPEGAHEIAALTVTEARALGLPDGTLATLPEAIEVARGRTGLMIDLKAPDLHEPILAALKAANFTDALVCGDYDDTLAHVKSALPDVAVSRTPDAAYHRDLTRRLATGTHLDALTVHWRTVGTDLMAAARAAGVLVLAWTVDHRHIADHVLRAGAHGITSNDVEMLAGLR